MNSKYHLWLPLPPPFALFVCLPACQRLLDPIGRHLCSVAAFAFAGGLSGASYLAIYLSTSLSTYLAINQSIFLAIF